MEVSDTFTLEANKPWRRNSARRYVSTHLSELARLLEPRVRREDFLHVVETLMDKPEYVTKLLKTNFQDSEYDRIQTIYKEMIEKSLLVVLIGARRHGKTATIFRIAEDLIRKNTGKDFYWIGYSEAVERYYPQIKQTFNMREIENSVVLFDEAAVFLDNRGSMTSERQRFIKQLPTMGHKDNTTIFLTQIDSIESWLWKLCDWMWFKPYPNLTFTRSKSVNIDYIHQFMIPIQKWQNYIFDRQNATPYFFDNELPEKWNDSLSKPYSLIHDSNKAFLYLTKLREAGLSPRDIETMLDLRGWTRQKLDEAMGFAPVEEEKPVKREDAIGVKCKQCGSYHLQRHGFKHYKDKKYQRYRCMNCNKIMQKEV